MADLVGPDPGSSQNNSNDSNDDKKKKEEEEAVSCVVKFRPCKEWCGEYGFDWVREYLDVFDERSSSLGQHYDKPNRMLKERMVQKFMDEKRQKAENDSEREKYDYDKFHKQLCSNAVNSNSVKNNTEKSWEKEQELNNEYLASGADPSTLRTYNDVREEEESKYIEKALDQYIKRNDIKSDENTWLYGGDEKQDEMLADIQKKVSTTIYTCGDEPVCVNFKSGDVGEVDYVVDRTTYGNIWLQKKLLLRTADDSVNGDEAVENASSSGLSEEWPSFLNSRIETGSIIQSLNFDDTLNEYQYPIYCDTDKGGKMQSSFIKTNIKSMSSFNSNSYTIKEESGKKTSKKLKEWFIEDFLHKGETIILDNAILVTAKIVEFTNLKNGLSYTLRYLNICGQLNTVVIVGDYQCHFVKGELKQVFSHEKGWQSVNSLKRNEEGKVYVEEVNNNIKKLLTDDMINNRNMSVEKLIKLREDGTMNEDNNGDFDKIKVNIYRPVHAFMYKLTEKDGLFDNNKEEEDLPPCWCWGDPVDHKNEIETWKEVYCREFNHETYRLSPKSKKDKNNSNNGTGESSEAADDAPIEYYVPILSITPSDVERTSIIPRGPHDAPKKKVEKNGIYNLQLFVEGDYKKLHFESGCSLVSILKDGIEVKEIDQSAGEKMEIQIKLNVTKTIMIGLFDKNKTSNNNIEEQEKSGSDSETQNNKSENKKKLGYDPLRDYLVDRIEVKSEEGKRVGSLEVRIYKPERQYVMFVKVKEKGRVYSKPFLDALEDQKASLRNVMLQAGIESIIDDAEIELDSDKVRKYKKGDKWDDNNKELPSFLMKEYFKEYQTGRYYFLIFSIDAPFTSSDTAAYTSPFDVRFPIVASNYISKHRYTLQTFPHEIGHVLSLIHSFQLYSTMLSGFYHSKYCFNKDTTSNIMDYNELGYSLKCYQWEVLRQKLKDYNAKVKPLAHAEYKRFMDEFKEGMSKAVEKSII